MPLNVHFPALNVPMKTTKQEPLAWPNITGPAGSTARQTPRWNYRDHIDPVKMFTANDARNRKKPACCNEDFIIMPYCILAQYI